MSNYEETFVTMRSCILFIILGFIQSVICCLEHTNHTQNESDLVCPVSWFRRKRAIDYTRWRANEETTPQFIVKVLDEDISPANNKKIVAVNIHPITKGMEKIIIGGAALPPPTTPASNLDAIREYTRFVPPTTVPASNMDAIILAPGLPPVKRPPFVKKDRNLQRDESPPANPQFLTRAPSFHQYAPVAPVAPVAFTKHTTVSPLTPTSDIEDILAHMTGRFIPTRTSPLPDIPEPTRTKHIADEYSPNNIFEDSDRPNLIFMTRTTFYATYTPVRTTFDKSINADESLIPVPKNIEEDIRRYESHHKSDKESDASYNMMFYDEETETRKSDIKTGGYYETDKHEESSTAVNYDDHKEKGEHDFKEAAAISGIKEEIAINDIPATHLEVDSPNKINNDNVRDYNITMEKSEKKVAPIMHLKNRFNMKLQPCNLITIRSLAFNTPRTLHEIAAQLKLWAENSPVAKWVDITYGNYTTLDNPIYMMIVDDPTSGQVVSAKQTVMIVAGIHGRDHHAVAAAMYLLYQLIERTSSHSELLSKYRFWVIPVFNPDGYDYSSTFPQRREWMKNLRQNWNLCKERASCQSCEKFGLECTVLPCYGVNLDRNFEYQWIPTEELRSEHPCGPLYAGTRQLSEPETLALTQFLHQQKVPLFTFIALKEGDVLGILYPYSHTKKKRALDTIYRQRATRAAAAAHSISGRHYVAGQTSEYLPLYAGGIEDWIDGHLGVDNTYTIMVFRPSESYGSKFLTERVVHEAFAAVDTLLLQSVEPSPGHNPVATVSRNIRNAVSQCILPTNLIILENFALWYLG